MVFVIIKKGENDNLFPFGFDNDQQNGSHGIIQISFFYFKVKIIFPSLQK